MRERQRLLLGGFLTLTALLCTQLSVQGWRLRGQATSESVIVSITIIGAEDPTGIDTDGPIITPLAPADDATEITVDANVSLSITDAGSGVSITQTTVTVAGISYDSSDPQFQFTGDPEAYVITINPDENFTGSQVVTVSVDTEDLFTPTANQTTATWSFTIAGNCATCQVTDEDPSRFAIDAPLDDTITFHVRDTGSGIDAESILVRLTGTGAAVATSPLTTITGTPADYTVTITLPAAIVANASYTIVIDASDIDGLDMTTVTYSFQHTASSSVASAPEETTVQNGGHRGEGTLTSQPAIDADHEAAPRTHYTDVQPGIWYEESLEHLLRRQALDPSQTLFRAEDDAVRAAFATVLVRLKSTLNPDATVASNFDDSDSTTWYHAFIEDAARHGWMLGYDECYGTRPCFTKPLAAITRAEAAAMIVRTYALPRLSSAPAFSDVPAFAWYADTVQIAADHCLLQGNGGSDFVTPDRTVNRAEMATMIDRAERNMRYGIDCGQPASSAEGLGASLLSVVSSTVSLPITGILFLMGWMGVLHWKRRRTTNN